MRRTADKTEDGWVLTVYDGLHSHSEKVCSRQQEWELAPIFKRMERDLEQRVMREADTPV